MAVSINKMDEKIIEKNIRKLIFDNGGFSLKYHAGMTTQSGIPDLICTYKGLAIFIEVKASEHYHITEIQKAQIRAIRACGNIAIVTNTVRHVNHILDYIDQLDDENNNSETLIDLMNKVGLY